jgi:hypothetical protein
MFVSYYTIKELSITVIELSIYFYTQYIILFLLAHWTWN